MGKNLNLRKKAFTLTELLVVLVILVILAAALLPVVVSAKAAALKTACVSNFRQASDAMAMYLSDYDQRFTPVSYQAGATPDPMTDRTWVQLLLPYAKSLSIFRDPADYGARPTGDGSFDEDLVPNDAYARYYSASLRSDIGYNYLYLSPFLKVGGGWQATPRSETEVDDPSRTLMFVDSIWGRRENGDLFGGGSWLVVPPCRYELKAGELADTFLKGDEGSVLTSSPGWTASLDPALIYGRAWPWHSGRMNVARVDGSIVSMAPNQLSQGCDVKPEWHGLISDPTRYMWSLNP